MDTYEQVSPERFSWVKRKLMAMLISLSGWRASKILTISENTSRDISRFYPHLAKKTVVIHLGIKFPVVSHTEFHGRFDFIFVGTLEPGKNLTQVLEAYAKSRHNNIHRLCVIGAQGWNQGHIPKLLDSLGIKERVDFLGYITDEELKQKYLTSLALLQASVYEGFGLPIIEAMACGCPVIAAHNSGLIEAGGDAALFFATHETQGMVDWMNRLCEDSSLGAECVRKGLIHAKNFTWGKTAEATSNFYGPILERSRSSFQ